MDAAEIARKAGAIALNFTPFGAVPSLISWFGGNVLTATKQRLGLNASLNDEVTVEVIGQPGVTKQQLYFCALAAANGIVRRFTDLTGGAMTPAYGTLVIEYDAADHWVRCTIQYQFSMGAINADGVRVGTLYDKMAVYRGPQCDVVGGDFDFTSNIITGIPDSSIPNQQPNLPLTGQPILTACPTTLTPNPKPINQAPAPNYPTSDAGPVIPSPNPKPPGDNRSRGAIIAPTSGPGAITRESEFNDVPGPTPDTSAAECCDKLRGLIPLFYAALTAPAANASTTFTQPTPGPVGG